MKRKSIIALLIGVFSFGMLSTSCDDMLSPSSERHSYVVAQDTLYSYWGIIKSLQNIAERYVVLGECRGDLISGTTYVSDTIKAILDYDMDLATDGSCRSCRPATTTTSSTRATPIWPAATPLASPARWSPTCSRRPLR